MVYRYDFAEIETHEVPFETISIIFVELGKFSKTLEECISPMEIWFYLFKNLKNMTDYPIEIQSEAFDYIFKAANIKKFTDMDNSIYIHELFAEMDEFNRIYSAEAIGREDAMLDVAKKMKDKGIDMETIIECTGLAVSQIENL